MSLLNAMGIVMLGGVNSMGLVAVGGLNSIGLVSIGGPVDVGHSQHRVEVEAPVAEALLDEALGVEQARVGSILHDRDLDFVYYQTDSIRSRRLDNPVPGRITALE